MKGDDRRLETLDEILASTSDVLFPAELSQRQVTIDSTDSQGDTPLHVAVRRNDRHAVRVLTEAGADVNAIGDMNETPLHVGVAREGLAIIDTLLRAGAKANIRSEFGSTAAESAAGKGGEVAKLFAHYMAT